MEDSGLFRHAKRRLRAAGVAFVLAGIATCAIPAVPPPSQGAVAALLASAIGGDVAPNDFVWEPSRGFVLDAFVGRRVVFLGRKGAKDAPRELYRASVTVTRAGRPMAVRDVVEITETSLADESSLVVSGERAAVSAVAGGRTQSVEIFDLAPDAPAHPARLARLRAVVERALSGDAGAPVDGRIVSFAHPPEIARYELQGTDWVFSFDRGSAILAPDGTLVTSSDDDTGAYAGEPQPVEPSKISGRHAPWWRAWTARASRRPQPAVAAPPVTRPSVAFDHVEYRFPPNESFVPVEGHAGFYRAETTSSGSGASVSVVAVDMRALGAHVVVGTRAVTSLTGHVPSGRLPAADRSRAVAAFVLPCHSGGAWDNGLVVSPLIPGLFTLHEGDGWLRAGPAPLGMPVAGNAFQCSDDHSYEVARRGLVCVTAAGHFVAAWSKAANADDLRNAVGDLQCAVTSPALAGEHSFGAFFANESSGAAAVESWESGADAALQSPFAPAGDSYVYWVDAPPAPSIAAPRGSEWAPATAPQPEPASIPAIYESTVDELGATITVRLFMPHRFDWAIRAGDEEKSHRFGGDFSKALSDADAARAFYAMGLGIGKRHAPLGLRIDGSTGHAFHGDGALLESRLDGLVLSQSHGGDPDGDATELPLTVVGRGLTSEARVRGPRERRADVCVMPDGTVLFAEADFDNHEPTANVLAELGCTLAAALDRGAERSAWSESKEASTLSGSHPTTALFALGRAMPGSLSAER